MRDLRLILTLLLQFITTISFAQDHEMIEDSLTVQEIGYELIDSNEIQSIRAIVKHSPTIVSYDSSDGVRIAYRKPNSPEWISVMVRFDSILTIQSMNFDSDNQPELIIKGEISNYGTGGGINTQGVLIISTKEIPRKVFDIDYGCEEESFGDKSNGGKGRYVRSYRRTLSIKPGIVKIGQLKRSALNLGCNLTQIHSGVYIMKDGAFTRR